MTITLMRGSDLIGDAVVDASTGQDLAKIKDVVFTSGQGAITGLTLCRHGLFGRRPKTVLPSTPCSASGTHIMMVANTDAIGRRDPLGRRPIRAWSTASCDQLVCRDRQRR